MGIPSSLQRRGCKFPLHHPLVHALHIMDQQPCAHQLDITTYYPYLSVIIRTSQNLGPSTNQCPHSPRRPFLCSLNCPPLIQTTRANFPPQPSTRAASCRRVCLDPPLISIFSSTRNCHLLLSNIFVSALPLKFPCLFGLITYHLDPVSSCSPSEPRLNL